MAMRKKAAATAKIRNAWRCPNCGYKVATVDCYACIMEAEQEKKRNSKGAEAQPKVANNVGEKV